MEKQLPVYTIEGTDFLVDVRSRELREVANPENIISFVEMEEHQTHYSFRYDAENKNVTESGERGVTVKVPPMKELDPKGMADHYGCTVEALGGKTDFDIIIDQDGLSERLKGRHPIIELLPGHECYINMHWGLLEPKDLMFEHIRLSDLDYCFDDERNNYWMVYDPKTRQHVELETTEIIAIPKDLIVLEIPGDGKLDPVGYARKHGFDQRKILRAYPLEMNLKARIVPWSETAIDSLIERNIRRLSAGFSNAVINGNLYLVDQDRQVLMGAVDRSKTIDLKAMDMNPDGTEYMCFFDTVIDKVVHPNEQNRQSSDLIMLVIPNPFLPEHIGKDLKIKELPTQQRAGVKASFSPSQEKNQKQSPESKQKRNGRGI